MSIVQSLLASKVSSGGSLSSNFNPDDISANWALDATRKITTQNTGAASRGNARSFPKEGALYVEIHVDSRVGYPSSSFISLSNVSVLIDALQGSSSAGMTYTAFGDGIKGNSLAFSAPSWDTGDVIMLALTTTNGVFWVGKNGVWATGSAPVVGGSGTATFDLHAPMAFSVGGDGVGGSGSVYSSHADLAEMVYPVPSGFTAWNAA